MFYTIRVRSAYTFLNNTQAIAAGTMDCFFPLIESFHTQDEPSYCGLGTLVTVLNALKIDPHRQWKGVWRYWNESLLECCERVKSARRSTDLPRCARGHEGR